MSFATISFEDGEKQLGWLPFISALEAGHTLPRAQVEDSLLYRGDDTVLTRTAWIDGFGALVKTATIFPNNKAVSKPTINGAVTLFSDAHGELLAVLDFHLVTKWKTAGDSLLAAKKLARPESRNILIVGAGTVAKSLREAYGALFPEAHFSTWSRSEASAQSLVAAYPETDLVTDLETAVKAADIVTCATMSNEPLILGEWLQPGQHIDLIGAYRPDMREADDAAIRRSRVFVDSRDTTIAHIGELMMPIKAGAMTPSDVVADFYDIEGGNFSRQSTDEVTLFKNGGGAHLDLMTSRHIQEICA